MVRPRGTPSTGRHRIEMTLRLDKNSRQVTFSKSRFGFFKKLSELSLLCGVDVAAIVFSEVGNVFALGGPSVDYVLRRYVPLRAGAPVPDDAGVDDGGNNREALQDLCREKEATEKEVAEETKRMNLIGDKVIEAKGTRRSWWEADTEMLGAAELPEFARALERLRDNVRRHVDKRMPTAAAPAPAPATAAVEHAGDDAASYYLTY